MPPAAIFGTVLLQNENDLMGSAVARLAGKQTTPLSAGKPLTGWFFREIHKRGVVRGESNVG